jgi:hypothetical protein
VKSAGKSKIKKQHSSKDDWPKGFFKTVAGSLEAEFPYEKAKKYDPKKVKLSTYEQSIEDVVDYKKMKRPTAAQQKKLIAAAASTLRELKQHKKHRKLNPKTTKAQIPRGIRLDGDLVQWIVAESGRTGQSYEKIMNIKLRAAMNLPEHEKWFFDNPKALASVRRGLEDARHGRVISLPRFNKKKPWKKKLRN